MTDLGNYIISGLMTNPTLNTEAIVVFVNQHNKQALQYLATKTAVEDVEIKPGMDLEQTETRMSKLEKTFKVQEGAAQGASICRFNLYSQNQGREETWQKRGLRYFLRNIFFKTLPEMS